MIYLDNGATSFPKPAPVAAAVNRALFTCANPGRGGHQPAMEAARVVYACRERASQMFDCQPEQVVLTSNCTHGLNIAVGTLVKPGDPVVISGFEHNAVVRPLHGLGANITVAGRRLFDPEDTLNAFEKALKKGVKAAVFTYVSNVFGYILPVEQLSRLCRDYGVPFIIDAAQAAGSLPVRLGQTGADFIAMPGHKGLLGPQGTGLLLCNAVPDPLLMGGTGSNSMAVDMPDFLPDRAEAGTLNVPGIAGLEAGLSLLGQKDISKIHEAQSRQVRRCAEALQQLGCRVFSGAHQAGTLSFLADCDCEELAQQLARQGVAVRGGLHCAPLAHESAGTLQTGTLRVSFGMNAQPRQTEAFIKQAEIALGKVKKL